MYYLIKDNGDRIYVSKINNGKINNGNGKPKLAIVIAIVIAIAIMLLLVNIAICRIILSHLAYY